MTRPPRPNLRSALLLTALALLGWLESQAAPRAYDLAFFGWLVVAIQAVAAWLGAAGAAIASATVVMVQWLAGSLAWLTTRFWKLVTSSGAMFAKVWAGAKRLWFDVLRPQLVKIAKWIRDAREWLTKKLKPVFELLAKMRKRILKIYETFVRPVLEAIETARAILGLLSKLGIQWAAKLDAKLAEVEHVITANVLKILSALNRVTDTLNSIVTFELLFQRVPFLASLRRDMPQWIPEFWAKQITPWSKQKVALLAAVKYPRADAAQLGKELGTFYAHGSGELAPVIDELADLWFIGAGLKAAKDES